MGWTFQGLNPGGDKRLLLLPLCPEQFWGPIQFTFQWVLDSSLGVVGVGVWSLLLGFVWCCSMPSWLGQGWIVLMGYFF